MTSSSCQSSNSVELFLELIQWPSFEFCSQKPCFPGEITPLWIRLQFLLGEVKKPLSSASANLLWTWTSFVSPRKENHSFYSEVEEKALPTTWRYFFVLFCSQPGFIFMPGSWASSLPSLCLFIFRTAEDRCPALSRRRLLRSGGV